MDKKKLYLIISLSILGLGVFLNFRKKNKFIGRNIIIGDSHAVGISKLLKNVEKSTCAVGGWMVNNLIQCISNQPVQTDVANVFISIGTNGLYSSNDKIEQLIQLLQQKFPNATFYVYGGSYGWSGSMTNSQVESRRNQYYKRFSDKSVILLKNGLGYFKTDAEAHSINTPQAKAIAQEINSLSS